MVFTTTVDLTNTKTLRAGVIPYVVINNSIYFLLGIDTKSKELTDFGGGVKKSENSLDGAIREFKEETSDIFNTYIYDIKNFENSKAITDNAKMTIVFLKLNSEWLNKAQKKFYYKKKYSHLNFEIDSVTWIHENRFRLILMYNNYQNIMWTKIQKFLKDHSTDDFYNNLRINI